MAAARQQKAPIRPIAGPDADEVESLGIAAAELKMLCPAVSNAEAVASAVISKWIIERSRRAAGARLTETVAFDLNDAKLRGEIEAVLPQVGEALGALPPTIPLFQLSRPQIVDVFAAAIIGWRAAAIARGENPSFPLDDPTHFDVKNGDPIPFGGET